MRPINEICKQVDIFKTCIGLPLHLVRALTENCTGNITRGFVEKRLVNNKTYLCLVSCSEPGKEIAPVSSLFVISASPEPTDDTATSFTLAGFFRW